MRLLMRSPNAVLNGGFLALFHTFLSNVFVEPRRCRRRSRRSSM